MATEKSAPPNPPRRWYLLVGLLVLLVLVVCLYFFYWIPVDQAIAYAKDFAKAKHPDISYEQEKTWRKPNGHWGIEFDSKPPVTVDVSRSGECKEEEK